MTTKEKIKIMQAYEDGKQIQSSDSTGAIPKDWEDWEVSFEPVWNWAVKEYRIKPELSYAPYDNTDEMIKDYCNRFDVKCKEYEIPVIWLVNAGEKKMIIAFRDGSVKMLNEMNGIDFLSMDDIFNECSYPDGSTVGKLV